MTELTNVHPADELQGWVTRNSIPSPWQPG